MCLALVNMRATKMVVIKNSNLLLVPNSYTWTRFARDFKHIQRIFQISFYCQYIDERFANLPKSESIAIERRNLLTVSPHMPSDVTFQQSLFFI